MTTTTPLLTLHDVSVSYQQPVLENISLILEPGTILGLVGANGAGKSSLVSAIAGAVSLSGGSMRLAGENYAPESVAAARAAGVGYIPQHLPEASGDTVAHTIFRTSSGHTMSSEEKIREANTVLADNGLALDGAAALNTLVPAERVLVELMRLSREETQLIVLDEVTASFNDLEISLFHDLARKLRAQGRSLIHVSHRLDELLPLSDRLAVLRAGRLHREFARGRTKRPALVEEIFGTGFVPQKRPISAMATEPVLELTEVTATPGVKSATLAVHAGEILGITGMRNSGADALTAVIAGTKQHEAGSLRLTGQQITFTTPAEALEHGIVHVPEMREDQDLSLEVPVSEVLLAEHPAASAGQVPNPSAASEEYEDLSLPERAQRLRDLVRAMRNLGIRSTNVDALVGQLSGGDQQKVALARSLGQTAKIFVLEQPTRGIDELAKSNIYSLLKELTDSGAAVVLSSTDTSELIGQCHRIAIMRGGEIVSVRPNSAHTEDSIMIESLGESWMTETHSEADSATTT